MKLTYNRLMSKSKILLWIRWLAVLPGSFILSILITFPLHWFLQLFFLDNTENDNSFSIRFLLQIFDINSAYAIEHLLSPMLIAFGFIIAGYKIAPTHKFKVSIILFLIYLLSMLISFLFLGKVANVNVQFEFKTLLAILGATVGLYVCKSKENEK